MKFTNVSLNQIASAALLAGLAFSPVAVRAQAGSDAALQAQVQHSLDSKRFSRVQVNVQGGVVTLTGHVERLGDKLDAEKKAQKTHHVASVNDEIAVAGGARVSDAELYNKLAKQLVYDRVGYGTTTFNALVLDVHNGVATLSGVVVDPADKESALSLIKNTPGVQGLVDRVQVAPPSPNDDRIRMEEARAVYGTPQLNKYALNPAKPIRISVVNGNVTLVGVVDNKGDRDIAGIRANGVPGVFSVKNDLAVAGDVERR